MRKKQVPSEKRITRAERLRAWEAAGMPSLNGPKGGQLFFGWTFDAFYTLVRSYELATPDLSLPSNCGVGFTQANAYRAIVLAAGLSGYFWVAVQQASDYHMMTFPAVCTAADVLLAIARWAPGVQFHWTSSPGARTTALPRGWHVPELYLHDMGNRLYFAYSLDDDRVFIGTSARVTVRVGQKHAQLLGTCRRAKQIALVRARAGTGIHDWYELTPHLLRTVYRWGAVHFHNVVLGRSEK